ncbi:DUF5686 and carboxypeptidase regulatory-like domain-containing protein [Mucilaginibacter daejeonensis]|uniref:DUF5686 and carboxypeptidase regulatory-like domain-containing protein n=1 Tax=Mucilaginibacter daejeonensis TaxID=398049 RepID=UPI001D17CF2B|nr:DUF5686 and carboxypeptidase regulatory-like domain-containing protein [Mucilaginibacter daejeonensis]UEG52691.1 DUF5686 and carboxypeptidase regulatory-like domain-containing protein [Mucilaginibacter daejeonensis]
MTALANAQTFTLKGTVKDQNGQPIPFVTVVVKGTSKGSPANSDGEYNLSLASGNYDILFKGIGYKQQIRPVALTADRVLNVQLEPESFVLQNVVVKAGGEDPAYAIIRKAIRKRNTYLTQVKSYQCDTYIKGLQRMLSAPKKFLGRDIDQIGRELGLDSNRKGILYLSESESKLSFMQPDRYHEEMVSSKVSGSNRAFSFNRASDLDVNFYQNLQNWEGISNRPLISPIADNALSYYNYRYMGETVENGETVNRIKVTPKRQYEPTFEGYIYIMDDSWRIHSTDLYLTKSSGINFLDTLSVKQQYIPVERKAWMPSSVKFEFTGGLLGFKIGGYFVAVYKNYDIDPKLDKKLFAEVMKVTAGVNKKDSTYWQQARPIPLTTEETVDYEKKAVLARKRESKTYLDSLDRANNKVSVGRFLFSGLNIRNRYNKSYFSTQSVLGSMLYNTVEGFTINYGASFRKQIDSARNKYLLLNGHVRYGFGNKLLHGNVNGVIPVDDYRIGFNVGSDVVDLNNKEPITPLSNSIATLFYRRNYQKLYDKHFAAVSVSRRIVGGLQASVGAEVADRKWLDNTSYYSFFYQQRRFTPNNPFAQSVDDHTPLFNNNRSFKINVRASYDFSDRYVTYPTGRYYLRSKYPKLEVSYTKGIRNFLGSDVDYDLLTASITKDDVDLGLWGKFSFYVGAGKFLNNKSVFYTDAKHFMGTEIFRYRNAPDAFLLLNYYTYSTTDQYLEGHIEHNFGGIVMSKIPLLRKLKLQEIVKANYLTTPQLKNYTELAAGLEFYGMKALYGWSYNTQENTKHAFRIEIGF